MECIVINQKSMCISTYYTESQLDNMSNTHIKKTNKLVKHKKVTYTQKRHSKNPNFNTLMVHIDFAA